MVPLAAFRVDLVQMEEVGGQLGDVLDGVEDIVDLSIGPEIGNGDPGEAGAEHLLSRVFPAPAKVGPVQVVRLLQRLEELFRQLETAPSNPVG